MCLRSIVDYFDSDPNFKGLKYDRDDEGHEYLLVPLPIGPNRTEKIMVSEINGEIYLEISLEIGGKGKRLDLRELSPECLDCIRDVLMNYNRQRNPVVLCDNEGNLGLKTFFTCLSAKDDTIKLFESARSQIRSFIIRDIKSLLKEISERCNCTTEELREELDNVEKLELV